MTDSAPLAKTNHRFHPLAATSREFARRHRDATVLSSLAGVLQVPRTIERVVEWGEGSFGPG